MEDSTGTPTPALVSLAHRRPNLATSPVPPLLAVAAATAMGTTNGEQPAAGASSDKLHHVESISQLPSGAGKISGVDAVMLGESLATKENGLIFPSPEFSTNALVSSPKQLMKQWINKRMGLYKLWPSCVIRLLELYEIARRHGRLPLVAGHTARVRATDSRYPTGEKPAINRRKQLTQGC